MDLFVLGAGFSKSFVPKAPLLARFLKDNEHLLNHNEFSAAKRFIEQCRFKCPTANIETVMTMAEEHSREASEQLKMLMVRILDKSFKKQEWENGNEHQYEIITEDPDDTLRQFAEYLLVKKSVNVVTPNYDILLENAVELKQKELRKTQPNGKRRRFHSGRCYGFQTNTWKKDGTGIRWQTEKERDDHLFILKLHGSVNWIVPADLKYEHRIVILSAHEENLYYKYREAQEYMDNHKRDMPLLVPPVLQKSSQLAHSALAQVWAKASYLVQKAERIVFVGYSFPPTDYHAEYLFRVNHPEGCEVTVIDKKECPGERKNLEERYRNIFGGGVNFRWGDAATQLKELLEL